MSGGAAVQAIRERFPVPEAIALRLARIHRAATSRRPYGQPVGGAGVRDAQAFAEPAAAGGAGRPGAREASSGAPAGSVG